MAIVLPIDNKIASVCRDFAFRDIEMILMLFMPRSDGLMNK